MSPRGILYLIPSALSLTGDCGLSAATLAIVHELDFFFVENLRSARRFLRRIGYQKDFNTVSMFPLNSDDEWNPSALQFPADRPAPKVGLLSEAGSPAVADPGAALVLWAHQQGWRVIPLPGPSAILLALMASGLNGQCFFFHGYLPVKREIRRRRIHELEKESRQRQCTQIIMETPYRNEALLNDLLSQLMPSTLLCIAADLTGDREFIATRPVCAWEHTTPSLKGRPALFLFHAGALRAG